MTSVIVVGALGVITITGGLFLRRLLGQLAELRRQITGIDRQMRAQRAHVTCLRQLITEDEDADHANGPQAEIAVANGGLEVSGDSATLPPPGQEPIRRKRHLGLYIGGAVSAAATIATAARGALRAHRNQFIGTLTAAAVPAATVTMFVAQPWSDGADQQPPPSSSTAIPSATSQAARHSIDPARTCRRTPLARAQRGPVARRDGTGSAGRGGRRHTIAHRGRGLLSCAGRPFQHKPQSRERDRSSRPDARADAAGPHAHARATRHTSREGWQPARPERLD